MRISEKQYRAMPAELRALFSKRPNPARDEVVRGFPVTARSAGGGMKDFKRGRLFQGESQPNITDHCGFGDSGSAARFFYCAKPSRAERNAGVTREPSSAGEATDRKEDTEGLNSPRAGAGRTGGARNIHPTVKPISLLRYLSRLITPPGGIILDPFMGSGSVGCAAMVEGFEFLGSDLEAVYVEIARDRINHWEKQR